MSSKASAEWKKVLVKRMNVRDAMLLGAAAAEQPTSLEALFHIYKEQDDTFRMKAAWVLSHAAAAQPEILKENSSAMLDLLAFETVSGALRELLKALTLAGVRMEDEGRLIDIAFKRLNEMHHDVAVRYNSMKLLEAYVLKYPELKEEYFACLQAQMELNTPTWRHMAARIVQRVEKKLSRQR